MAADQDLNLKTLPALLPTLGRGAGIPTGSSRGFSASPKWSDFEVIATIDIDEQVEAIRLTAIESIHTRRAVIR